MPELAGSGYDPCTVRDVLTMTSGVDWVEDHRDPSSPASRLVACFGPGGGESRALLARVGPRSAPGTRWEYCTADSQVLDWARERATGAPYDVALGALWRTLGCTSDAFVGTDAAGVPMAGGSLAATAPRLGPDRAPRARRHRRTASRCSTRSGCTGARVRRTRSPRPDGCPAASPRTPASAGTGGRSTPPGGARPPTAAAASSRYVDRDLDVVVVKTSQWPYDDSLADRQYRDLSYLGMPAVALAASRL